MAYVPPSIEDGLKPHLDRLGVSYDEFVETYEGMKRLGTINKTVLADKFGVERQAIYRWIRQYEKEAEALS